MPLNTQPPPTAPKPKRRWLQFGLRTLLGLTAVAAVGMGLWVNSAERQRRAVAVVLGLEGGVSYADDHDWSNYPTPERAGLRKYLGHDYVSSVVAVELSGTEVTDAELARLKGLTRLESLSLWGTRVTDAGLEYLDGLTQLESLEFAKTKVTDTGLAHLKGMTWLLHLDLRSTEVTDAGLVHLKGLTQLEWLDLAGTKVTDAGLLHLKGMTQLGWLDVSGTKVTDAGIAKLQRALPNCETSTDRWP